MLLIDRYLLRQLLGPTVLATAAVPTDPAPLITSVAPFVLVAATNSGLATAIVVVPEPLRVSPLTAPNAVVEMVVSEGPKRLKELMEWGAVFDKDNSGRHKKPGNRGLPFPNLK